MFKQKKHALPTITWGHDQLTCMHDCLINLYGISNTTYICYCGSQHELQAVESHNNHETAICNSCKHSLIKRAVTIW